MLSRLLSLSVEHPYVKTCQVAEALCLWIKKIIARAPLEDLHLQVVDDFSLGGSPNVSLDSLVYHLATRHRSTLRVLRMHWSFFGLSALSVLCSCVKLESLAMVITDHPIVRSIYYKW